MSEHQKEDALLADRLQAAYSANRGVYGSPRLHVELRTQGIKISRKRVARLMRGCGLCARRPHHRTTTTHAEPAARVASNVLARDFTANRPNEKWTGDITAVWTYEGWLYVAVVLDLFSRRVIGWAMAATQEETLIEAAFRMALLGRHPSTEMLFHSDRGSQYTSDAYRNVLAQAHVTASMSRTGKCGDRVILQHAQRGMRGAYLVPDSEPSQASDLRVCRDVL